MRETLLPCGWMHGVDPDEYFADPAVSNSMLTALDTSPWHCWVQYLAPADQRQQRKTTGALNAGSLLHCLALEPQAFDKRYTVRPVGLDLRTKAGQVWMADQPQGVQVITADQKALADAQLAALHKVDGFTALVESAFTEETAVWEDAATGLRCKARFDMVRPLRHVDAGDVKTSASIRPDDFARSVAVYGYHRQQAHYSAGFQALTGEKPQAFGFYVVSSTPPIAATLFLLDDEAVLQGQAEVRHLLDQFARCVDSGKWPAPHDSGPQLIGLPRWALPQEEMEVSYDD